LVDRGGGGTVRGEYSFSPKPQVRLPVDVVEATAASHHNRRRGDRPSVRGSECEVAKVRLSTSIASTTLTVIDSHRPKWAGSKDKGSVGRPPRNGKKPSDDSTGSPPAEGKNPILVELLKGNINTVLCYTLVFC
jgi:hypothetical protein